MSGVMGFLKRFWMDGVFIGVPLMGAFACWHYELPIWMMVVCLLAVGFALVSLLGDLGLFGGDSQ